MSEEHDERLVRRQVIEAGVATAALLVLPEACSSSSTPAPRDASVDVTMKDVAKDVAMEAAPPCKTSFVDAGGGCAQSDQTAAVNILKAAIDQPGTSYEFADCRYMDPACGDDRIILIHPTTKTGYVALSGACPHNCCDRTMGTGGPAYLTTCALSVDMNLLGGFDCNAPDAGPPDAGGADAGGVDGGAEAGVDGGTEAGADAAPDVVSETSAEGGLHAGQILTDVLYCSCHGSIFDAITGDVLNGPASSGLQKLSTCEADGWIFVTIPK
jgi:Rieske Fe-S protein